MMLCPSKTLSNFKTTDGSICFRVATTSTLASSVDVALHVDLCL